MPKKRNIKYFLPKLLLLKLGSCFFAVFVFARYTTLGDAERYINAGLDDFSFDHLLERTNFTDSFFALLAVFFGHNDSLHFVVTCMVVATIYFVFRNYKNFITWHFWLLLLLPSFA